MAHGLGIDVSISHDLLHAQITECHQRLTTFYNVKNPEICSSAAVKCLQSFRSMHRFWHSLRQRTSNIKAQLRQNCLQVAEWLPSHWGSPAER